MIFLQTISSSATSFGGIGSLFYLLFCEIEDRPLQKVANTTGLVCDRVARVLVGGAKKKKKKWKRRRRTRRRRRRGRKRRSRKWANLAQRQRSFEHSDVKYTSNKKI